MNINSIVVIESLTYIILALALGKYITQQTKNKIYVIFNYIVWGFIAVVSLFLNLNKIVYFISSIFIGTLIIVGYIFLKFKFEFNTNENKDNIMLFFYILLATSIISIIGFILSKKYIIFMNNSQPPMGAPGEIGPIGKTGESYFLEKIPVKCLDEIITHAEELLVSIKKKNKIPFKSKEYQLKNTFLKNNLQRICHSKQFLDPFYGNGNDDTLKQPECINHPYPSKRICSNKDDYGNTIICDTTQDCFTNTQYNYDALYKNRVSMLKSKVSEWIKIILRNNCEENIKLKEMLGGKKYENLEDLDLGESDLRRFNNKMGHKFIDDYFFNDVYWDEYLVKKINNNPFDIIKQDPVWNWGIPVKYSLENCQVPSVTNQ